MKIGITYDLKTAIPPEHCHYLPDDFEEEFDSPRTIEAIAAALRGLGHDVEKLGDGRELLERLLAEPPDFVFNLAEGQGIGRSREARVPGVLEMLGIPYTGSDPLTLAVTLDKDCAKRLVQSAGVAVPRGWIIGNRESNVEDGKSSNGDGLSSILDSPSSMVDFLPLIVKPAWEGSSKGIRAHCLVKRLEDLPEVIDSLQRDHRQPILVEEFIDGPELTVGMIGNDSPEILGMMRIEPNHTSDKFIYSLEVKRDFLRQVRYECPARLPAATLEKVEQAARTAFQVLGCRDVARIDFRLRNGIPYFLEANPLPGLNPQTSDLVILAGLRGWSYSQLIESIMAAALRRHAKLPPPWVRVGGSVPHVEGKHDFAN
jgi:D-alanine-D-alanine ligase